MIDLSNKLRPTNLDNFVSQSHIISKDKALYKQKKKKDIPHLFFYGKPGTGKTTLAKIIAREINIDYYYFNATSGAYKGSKIKSMSFAPFLAYDIQSNGEKFSKIKVVISEGKNRELRRFFAHFGLDVLDLKRLEYGGISLNNLPTGKTRFLTKEEYKNLRIFMNEDDRSL